MKHHLGIELHEAHEMHKPHSQNTPTESHEMHEMHESHEAHKPHSGGTNYKKPYFLLSIFILRGGTALFIMCASCISCDSCDSISTVGRVVCDPGVIKATDSVLTTSSLSR